jgi:hypothetical protein
MKKCFSVTTVIIIVMTAICISICAWQTACMVNLQNVFAADHPTYVPHSWTLLGMLLGLAVLAYGQNKRNSRREMKPANSLLYGIMSALMIVLEVLALRSAADQHYHMGMLISDYGIAMPFHGGWLLMGLIVALVLATAVQLVTIIISALMKYTEG